MNEKTAVLIVDDERYVLAGLSAKIPWEELGMHLAGTATNGAEALSFLEETSVDIVITDILMPEIDGLELIALASTLARRPRFVVLSGHGEFEFARRAMSFGVRHYALKPTRIAEVVQALTELRNEIDAARSDGEGPDSAYPIDLLREGLARAILGGESLGGADHRKAFAQIGIDPETARAMIVGIDLGETVSPALSRSVCIVASRVMSGCTVLGSLANGSCSVLLVVRDDSSSIGLTQIPVELRKLGTLKRCVTYTAVVPIAVIAEIYPSFMRSCAGDFYSSAEQVRLFGADDDAGDDEALREETSEVEDGIASFGRCLQAGDETGATARVEDIISAASAVRLDPVQLASRLTDALADVARTIGGPELDATLERINRIRIARDVDQLRTIMGPLASSLSRLALQLRQSPALRSVNAVKESVRKRYGERGLSLKRIASSDVYANADYLGRVFRNETGQGFSDYLREVRMERAGELLRAFPQLPVHEIADRVGFGENPQYFSTTFRQHFGVSPSEHRQSRRSDTPYAP
ncbi:MAG TPA: response regulator [Spirochaetia bacterium]|nr:response regulator [Spirochaetia bacterium]